MKIFTERKVQFHYEKPVPGPFNSRRDRRPIRLDFNVPVPELSLIAALGKRFQTAWAAVEAGVTACKLKGEAISGQNVRFYSFPEQKNPTQFLHNVDLKDFSLSLSKTGTPVLHFSIRAKVDKDSATWFLTQYGTDVYMEIEDVQPSLLAEEKAVEEEADLKAKGKETPAKPKESKAPKKPKKKKAAKPEKK
jgi:hypothetical protein